ncbi:hypothetical protein Tco_0732208 [Tanacetum coccineum]
MISKNDDAKMVLYNDLPKKEYERIFICKTAKDVWNSLIITHQDNKQVNENKIDLFVQKYEEFVISDDETIDCMFARFNTIITSLKALDESFSSRNHVRKFLRALPTKWRPKVTAIEESKDLSTLPLDELIGNLKIYEVVLEKDSGSSKIKKEKYKSLALKARKVLSDKEESCSGSDEEYAIKRFQEILKEEKKGKEERRCFKCGDPNNFISDYPKHSFNDQTVFVGGCWSDSEEEDDSKKDKIYLMAFDNNEVLFDTPYYRSSSLDSESLQNEYNNFESSTYFLQEMIEKQRSQKDKHGFGFTEAEASTSKTKTEKLGQVDNKTSTVELTEPVSSAREPASSIVGNWPSAESIMAEPLPPNHVFDFPANEPAPELENPIMDVEEDLDMDIDEPSTYEVGGPSSTVPEAPHLVGRPLLVVASRVALHHREIGALCMRADKMENMQTRALSLVRKVDGVSDAQVADSIAIPELQPRMTAVEEGVQTLAEHGVLVASKLDETDTQVLEMMDIVNNYPRGQVDALREEMGGLHGSIETMSQKMQTLETALQEVRAKNQDLQTRLSASECNERCMVAYMLWMEERISALELRPPSRLFFITMPPRRLKRMDVERLVLSRVAEAIAEYERNKTNAGGPGPANTRGVVAPDVHGCSYKTFLNFKPHSFNGTEGVVGLSRWFEKMEQVFEISKCAEEDKVKFAACTFEGRALTSRDLLYWSLLIVGVFYLVDFSFDLLHTIIKENLPPPNNDPNILEDEHAHAPEHAPIAPNPAPIQPNNYLANDEADPEEEPEEEEEPIPEQALAAPVGFSPQWIGGHDPNNNNRWIKEDDEDDVEAEEEDEEEMEDEEDEEMEVEDNDGENDDVEVYNPYEEADPLNRPPPSPETAEREFMNAPVTRSTIQPIPPIRQFSGTFYVGEGSSATVFNPALCKVYPPGPMVNDPNTLYSRLKTLTKQMWDRFRVESSSSRRLERNDMRIDSFDDDLTALDSTFREQMQEMKKLVAGLNEQFQQIQGRDLRAENEMLRIRFRTAKERAEYNHIEAEYYKNH